VRRVLMVPGWIKCSFRVLRGVHLMHLGLGTSHFGLDGDPWRGYGGKRQLPNAGFAGAAAPCSSFKFKLSPV
jgi:hypothetical protein